MKLALSQSLAGQDPEFRHRVNWVWWVPMVLPFVVGLPFGLYSMFSRMLSFGSEAPDRIDPTYIFLGAVVLVGGMTGSVFLFNWLRRGRAPEASGRTLYADTHAAGMATEATGRQSHFNGLTHFIVTEREVVNLPWFPLDWFLDFFNQKSLLLCRIAKADILAVRVESAFFGHRRKYHLTYAGVEGQQVVAFIPTRHREFEQALDPGGHLRAKGRWRDPTRKQL